MDPDRASRRRALFDAAADLEPAEQVSFLAKACADDPALRADVSELLGHDMDAEPSFLRSPLAGTYLDIAGDAAFPAGLGQRQVPERIGPYEILRVLGEGGMGVVYEARQENPRRTVALKVIHPRLASKSRIQRFRREALILGQLQHPGIAHVYEAGTATRGVGAEAFEQPYLAMERVVGTNLTAYLCAADPAARDVLVLMAKICDAVQHAHERDVIHRDLKPGNILVTASGAPKILDFGVARLADTDLEARSLQTNVGQVLGTVPYMSPEQLVGHPGETDARTDVYALGVILYEILAGHLPLDVRHCGIAEAARVVQEQEPSRLSSVNSTYRGDLDCIVGKAIEKERERRYATAGAMAADIRRHLADEPIMARPATTAYQLRKFARRNKGLVAGVGATLVTLLLGLVGMIWLAHGETVQRRAAQASELRAERVAYRASVSAAERAVREFDRYGALHHLESVPARLRGWEWQHLRARLDESLVVIPAGPHDVHIAAAFSSDGILHTVSGPAVEGGVDAWFCSVDPATGVQTRDRHVGIGSEFRLDSRARTATYMTADGQWRTVDRASGTVVQPGLHPQGTAAPLLAWDGNVLAVVDAASGSRMPLRNAPAPYGPRHAISADGSLLAYQSGSTGGTQILVYDTRTGRRLHSFPGHGEAATGLVFRPDQRRLVSVSADRTMRLWNLEDGGPGEWDVVVAHRDRITMVTYSDDGRRLATAGKDQTIRVWAADTGKLLVTYMSPGRSTGSLKFSPDGRHLLSQTEEQQLRIWPVPASGTPRVLSGHTLYIDQIGLGRDGSVLASSSWDGTLRFWDTASGEPLAVLRPGREPLVRLRGLAFSPDGLRIATVGHVRGPNGRHRLLVLDAATGSIQQALEVGGSTGAVVFGPDGKLLALQAEDGEHVLVVDTTSGSPVARLAGSLPGCFCPGTPPVFLTLMDQRVVLYDMRTWERLGELRGHELQVLAATCSPDGRHIATGSMDRTVRVWDRRSGRQVAVLRGHSDDVLSVVFSPDGKRIASGGRGHEIRLWDTATFEAMARLQGHARYVASLAFSPDGRRLYSGSGDYTVRIWELDPLRVRVEAGRRRRRLLEKAEPHVRGLFARLTDPQAVVAHLRADASLAEPVRKVALQVALRLAVEGREAARRGDD